ncbi:MAG: TetR/AcrR family transcriptional regulator [Acidobacteriota bacterium]|nr:TetR/AcrR family transcriptional regulator [Acidobacteriota bacterium]
MPNQTLTTRELILQQGLDLLSSSGLSGVTLGLLADRTGLSKSGLFAHFHSKEELQIELLQSGAHVADEYVIKPAMCVQEGLPRLEALLLNWFGWTKKAGLTGGCPVAAGMFELDDVEGPLRQHVLAMESHWRNLLKQLVHEAIGHGHLRTDLDVDQFVWEICGAYLSHHASLRFVRDPRADFRARTALEGMIERAQLKPVKRKPGSPRRVKVKRKP